MPTRKFYVGDAVEIASASSYASKHSYDGGLLHKGVIRQTTISRRSVGWNSVCNYTVECECGQQIHPVATDLTMIATPSDPEYVPINHDTKLRHFLATVHTTEDSTVPLVEQVRAILDSVRPMEKYVLAMRFGIAGVLDDSPFASGQLQSQYPLRRTLADLGEELGLTRERIRQIEGRGLRRAIGVGYVL